MIKVGEVPPRLVSSHPKLGLRVVTLINGAMRIVPAPKSNRIQGVSRKEWRRLQLESLALDASIRATEYIGEE